MCLYPALFLTLPSDREQIWHACADRYGTGSHLKKIDPPHQLHIVLIYEEFLPDLFYALAWADSVVKQYVVPLDAGHRLVCHLVHRIASAVHLKALANGTVCPGSVLKNYCQAKLDAASHVVRA